MSKKHRKEKMLLYIICSVFLICVFYFIYNIIFEHNVKYSQDIKTSLAFEELPNDTLIKDYESYKSFINKYLNNKEYIEEVKSNNITYEVFNNYDYLVTFYRGNICNETKINSIKKLKSKVVVTIEKEENDDCDLETRILFIPLPKNKYKNTPTVIIKK